jgi:hypothetical protein
MVNVPLGFIINIFPLIKNLVPGGALIPNFVIGFSEKSPPDKSQFLLSLP